MPRRYMLDTNIFDAVVKGKLKLDHLPSDGQLCATTVQLAELERTPDNGTRAQLSALFKEIITDKNGRINPPFSFCVNGAGFDQGEWRTDGAAWLALKNDLDQEWESRSSKKKKRSREENNIRDATIAEAALYNGCIMLTGDEGFALVVAKHGIEAQLVDIDRTGSHQP